MGCGAPSICRIIQRSFFWEGRRAYVRALFSCLKRDKLVPSFGVLTRYFWFYKQGEKRMKRLRLLVVGVMLLGGSFALSLRAEDCVATSSNVFASARQESLDELDALVDEAAHDESFATRAPLQEPSGIRLFFMKMGVPLVGLYTNAVLKYRLFKAWMQTHCFDPFSQRISVLFHRQENTNASETTRQK